MTAAGARVEVLVDAGLVESVGATRFVESAPAGTFGDYLEPISRLEDWHAIEVEVDGSKLIAPLHSSQYRALPTPSSHPGHSGMRVLAVEERESLVLEEICVFETGSGHAPLWDGSCVLCDDVFASRVSYEEALVAGRAHRCEP